MVLTESRDMFDETAMVMQLEGDDGVNHGPPPSKDIKRSVSCGYRGRGRLGPPGHRPSVAIDVRSSVCGGASAIQD